SIIISSFFFFFFQAEDGIRDFHVTGVQTCALPIYYYPEFKIGSEVEPCSTVAHNIKAIGTSTQLKQSGRHKNIRVLVADDSLAVRRQLTIEFDSMDVKMDSVADGEAAVRATEKEKYDVIFLDGVMPEDGRET